MRQSVTRRFTNTAPMTGPDPHSDPRNSPAARTQKSEFLKVGGAVVDVCSGCRTSRRRPQRFPSPD